MDPSHIPKHSDAEIEKAAIQTLKNALPWQNSVQVDSDLIPIDIDLVLEKHKLFDSIIFLPGIKQRYGTEAVLLYKPGGRYNIALDEKTSRLFNARTTFSIAHELGHIVLHEELYSGCSSIDDYVELSKSIERSYGRLEREASRFAGAVLIPRLTIWKDTNAIYEGIIKGLGGGGDKSRNGIVPMLYASLTIRYKVSRRVLEIRLEQLKIDHHINQAVAESLDFIPWD